MALTIVNTGVGAYLEGNAFIKELVLGEPGAGKTRSASFWPQPIFANCERKSMSLLDRNVASAQIGSLADMDQLLTLLRMEGQKPQSQRRWQTLVIDTFDAYQRTLINERLTKERREKMINDDWNWLGTKISQFLERVANLPMHVIINLHVKDVTEGEGDDRVVKQKPHLKGDVRDQIAAEFDLVGFMETYWSVEPNPEKQGERIKVLRRRIQWTQDERHPILKDCSGQLGNETEVDFTEQDFLRIWTPIIGSLDDAAESTVTVAMQAPETTAPTGPLEGGPVATPDQAAAAATPAKKAAKKAAPKKAAAAKPDPAPASATSAAPEPSSAAAPEPTNAASSNGSGTAGVSNSGADSAPAQEPTAGEPEGTSEPAPSPAVGTTESADASNGAATPVPAQSPSDDTAADAGQADDVAQAQAALADGGVQTSLVSESEPADSSGDKQPGGHVCGDGEGPWRGCGKDFAELSQTERDKGELAYVRWRNRLCPACFQLRKNNQLPEKSAA